MSLGIVFKGPEGIVLAADSRVTLTATLTPIAPPGTTAPPTMLLPSTFDNATKLLKVKGQNYVGAVTYGAGAIGSTEPRTAHSFLPEFDARLAAGGRLTVEEFATQLGAFFVEKWNTSGMPAHPADTEQMVFLVGGFDPDGVYGRLFEVHVPNQPTPAERMGGPGEFGALWGGQRELVDRMIQGYDPRVLNLIQSELHPPLVARTNLEEKLKQLAIAIPYQFLPLQDSIDLAIFLVRMTITLQTWQIGIRGVGGAIDVATITQTDGFTPIQQKTIRGEIVA
jgi:hypothetical protein